jgi:molybdate transport system substrate-binding protein
LTLIAGAHCACSCTKTPRERSAPIIVFAAASTAEVVQGLIAEFTRQRRVEVRTSFAASSTLAQQIKAGAAADLFLSADVAWVDHLDRQNLLERGSRVDLLGNRLVLVASKDRSFRYSFASGTDLSGVLSGYLALGDPDHVPAGRYARQALEHYGQWKKLERRIAAATDVRAAMAFVENGSAGAALVYRTDAALSRRIQVVTKIPPAAHRPIVYPLVLSRKRHDDAPRLYDYFLSAASALRFRSAGFVPLRSPPGVPGT